MTSVCTVMFDHMSGPLCSLEVLSLNETVSGLIQVLANTLNEPACKERTQDLGVKWFFPGLIRLIQDNPADPSDPKTLLGHYSLAHYWPDIEKQLSQRDHWVLMVALRSGRNAKRMQFLLDQQPVTLTQDDEDYVTGHLRYFVTHKIPRLYIVAKNRLCHWDVEMVSRLVIGTPGNYHLLPDKFKVVPEIAMVVLAQDALLLRRMPACLQGNLDVVMFAITLNRNAYWSASEDLRVREQVMELFKQKPPQVHSQDLMSHRICQEAATQVHSQELTGLTAFARPE